MDDGSRKDAIDQRRLWPVRVIGLFLLLQGLLFLAIAIRTGLGMDWQRELIQDALAAQVVHALSTTGFLVLLAALAFLAALGFAFIRPGGWLLAMIVQGLTLLSGLILHFRDGTTYAYALLASGVLLVFYINSFRVRAVFHRNGNATGAAHGQG